MKHSYYRIRMRYGRWHVDVFYSNHNAAGTYGAFDTQDAARAHADTLNLRNGDHTR